MGCSWAKKSRQAEACPTYWLRYSIGVKSLYSVHPAVAMAQKGVAGLKEKTGRSLEEWLSLIERAGLSSDKERRVWLKSAHGLGLNYASWIVGRGGADDDFSSPEAYLLAASRYVSDMFSGGKAGLKPIYDSLLALGLGLGKDVKACPCKTMVP